MSGSIEKRLNNITTWARNKADKMALDRLYEIMNKQDLSPADMVELEKTIRSAREDKEE